MKSYWAAAFKYTGSFNKEYEIDTAAGLFTTRKAARKYCKMEVLADVWGTLKMKPVKAVFVI